MTSSIPGQSMMTIHYSLALIVLTLWRPLLPCRVGTVKKHSVPDRVKPSFVIFDIRAL